MKSQVTTIATCTVRHKLVIKKKCAEKIRKYAQQRWDVSHIYLPKKKTKEEKKNCEESKGVTITVQWNNISVSDIGKGI